MEDRRWKFSLRDILVGMIALGVCFAIGAKWLGVEREKARALQCADRLKSLALGVHNCHDVLKRFPPLSYRSQVGRQVSLKQPSHDYSWCVRVLPYIEETNAYNNLSQISARYTSPAFAVPLGPTGRPPWSMEIKGLRCPTYSGPEFATATEYMVRSGVDSSGKPYGVAISNFAALTATHIENAVAEPELLNPLGPNGVIVRTRNIRWSHITDGTSKTLMLCETRDSVYSSWYDGDVGWFVAADPNGRQPSKDASDFWVTSGGSSLQLGPGTNTPKTVYLPRRTLATMTDDRKWGPSSEHLSGTVNHAMADGSVRAMTANIDPTLYLQLTTRAGGEPVTPP
jgi:hypothetical protein